MEGEKTEQKWCTCKEPQPESSESEGSESESETSSSNSYLSDFDPYFGPDGEPWGSKPYQFEPLATSGDEKMSDPSNEVDYESRLTNLDWCNCGHCEIMNEANECVCCNEIAEVMNKNNEVYEVDKLEKKPNCITECPPFETVCLNKWVLYVAELDYIEEYGKKAMKGMTDNEKKRKIACLQLVGFCWGLFDRDFWVKLPSCALKCIRARYP